MPTVWKSKDFLVVTLLLQFIVCFIVFVDFPVIRQVIGFVYLTFVPGFIIVKLLKLDELDGLETVLLSVGLSVAFLMLAGLLINEFCFLFGISRPLSLMPLTVILNSLILMGVILVYLRSRDVKLFGAETLRLSPLALLLIFLPILSLAGAMWINAFENNIILLFVLIVISLLFVIGVISRKRLPPRFYPIAVLMVAISLLFHSSLISEYIVAFGSDVMVESSVFKTTQNNAYWSSTNPYFGDVAYGRLYAMLSVTVLPTIYSILLNMDPTWMFKVLVPLIFSLVPLGLYKVWQTFGGRKLAFISSFLFMAQSTFYTEMLGLPRQMVAELFFVLLLLVILHKKMKPFSKIVCFMIFSFALVTSHYSLAEIFLFFISFVLISLVLLKRPSRNITANMVVFFFIVMFAWYIYTSGSTVFDSFLSYGDYVYNQLGDFFNPTSRGQTVLRALGMEESPSIWNTISRTFAYLTQVLIVIGFVGVVTKRIRIHLEKEYLTLSLVAMAFLAALILVPGLANTLNMTRFYHILLFFLAPFCVMGAETMVKLVSKRGEEFKVSILLLIVLVPYFLFQTGFVYEVTGSQSWSLSLSGYRLGPRLHTVFGFVTEQEVFGAKWLSEHVNMENLTVHADGHIFSALVGYGSIYMERLHVLTNITNPGVGEFVYLGELNVVYGIVVEKDIWNTSDVLAPKFLNEIYTNGDCEIYGNTVGPS